MWENGVQHCDESLVLGGVKDVASYPHEQTKSNRVFGFQTLDAVFPKGSFQIIYTCSSKTRKQARLIFFQLVFIEESVKVVGHS